MLSTSLKKQKVTLSFLLLTNLRQQEDAYSGKQVKDKEILFVNFHTTADSLVKQALQLVA